ncbi:MAG: hypothetical protein ACJAWL_000123 [Motiliproteus sp.]|jgi:hypothetical protein
MRVGSIVLILGEISEPGQLLAQDVLTAGGQVLLRQGTPLTAKLHKLLIERGYTQVGVQATVPVMTALEVGTRLDLMFECNESTPCMRELRGMFERYHQSPGEGQGE